MLFIGTFHVHFFWYLLISKCFVSYCESCINFLEKFCLQSYTKDQSLFYFSESNVSIKLKPLLNLLSFAALCNLLPLPSSFVLVLLATRTQTLSKLLPNFFSFTYFRYFLWQSNYSGFISSLCVKDNPAFFFWTDVYLFLVTLFLSTSSLYTCSAHGIVRILQ